MYGKIWPAFEDRTNGCHGIDKMHKFLEWLWWTSEEEYIDFAITLTSAPDLAESLLEYFREKEKDND